MNLPNYLTLARIAMIPVLVAMIHMPDDVIQARMAQAAAVAIFVLAALTDWLDGYLARVLKQTSSFGAFADPVADKLLTAACLILLVHMTRLSSIVAVVIIGREIAVSALREWMATIGQRNVVAVAPLAKLKTVSQFLAIPFLLIDLHVGWFNSLAIGTVLIWVATVLTVWSMVDYMRAAQRAVARANLKAQPGAVA